MKIVTFDIDQGVYNFELESINSEMHVHPAIEILYSPEGDIQLTTDEFDFQNVTFAIIPSNIPHKLITQSSPIKVLMLECSLSFFQQKIESFSIKLDQGIYIEQSKTDKFQLFQQLSILHKHEKIPKTENSRIKTCLHYLNGESSDYHKMIETLKAALHLSESRLSHLFKQEMGISLKKYLVWARLRKAFELVVGKNLNMYEAALESGFYDQAHLSKAFKQMLGISPSGAYNSRTLQDK